MIAYDLHCVNDHSFEGWFEDAKAYQSQKKKGLITCPVCNASAVSRVPSTFAIRSSRPVVSPSPTNAKLAEISKQIVDYVEKNFDNVGSEFANEALKMHYGVKEPRNIRGTSTEQEEKTLKDEGIDFLKIPVPTNTDTES
jgi:hypothetical protein